MKRKFVFGVLFCSCLLVGCSLTTPVGTLNVSFDKNKTSDKVIYEDEKGNKQEFDTENISGQIDSMLDDVALPNGATNEELKNFVHDSMDTMGISDTIDVIENSLSDNINEVENSVDNGAPNEKD